MFKTMTLMTGLFAIVI